MKRETVFGYAIDIVNYVDTIQEAFNVRLPEKMRKFLNEYQSFHKEENIGDVRLKFGNEDFTIWKGGSAGGNKWVLENEIFQFHIRETDTWAISVRYLAAGLWQYGHEEVRKRAREAITTECTLNDRDFIRLSRVDYAFDFYSPAFSMECMSLLVASNLCLTSGVKAGVVFTSKSVETLTMGVSKGAAIQIQIYNKTQQIKDKPDAAWIKEIWQEEGFHPVGEMEDVWRVEVRFKKDALKDRRIETFEEFWQVAPKLICEALENRRMVKPTGSENKKERWDWHPLWCAAYEAAGAENQYIARGRKLVGTRKERIELLDKQLMGIMRSKSVLYSKDFDKANLKPQINTLLQTIELDPDHAKKVRAALNKYQYIDEAK